MQAALGRCSTAWTCDRLQRCCSCLRRAEFAPCMKHPCIFRALPAPVILHLLRIWAALEACSVEDCLSCAAQQPDAGRHPGIQLGEAAGRGRLPWINCFSHEPREDPNAAAAGLPGQRLAALGAASVCRVHNGLQAGATWQALLARHVQLQSALQATTAVCLHPSGSCSAAVVAQPAVWTHKPLVPAAGGSTGATLPCRILAAQQTGWESNRPAPGSSFKAG